MLRLSLKTSRAKVRAIALIGLLASTLPVLAALYFQHKDGLVPCHLCLFQRASFLAAATVFLVVLLHGPAGRVARWLYSILGIVLTTTGLASAGRQVWLQLLPADQVPSCGASLDMMMDMLPLGEVITRVFRGTGECAVVDWTLLGLSMAWWSLGFLALVAILFLLLPFVRD